MTNESKSGDFGPYKVEYEPETHELKIIATWRRSGSLMVLPRTDNSVLIRCESKPLAPGERPVEPMGAIAAARFIRELLGGADIASLLQNYNQHGLTTIAARKRAELLGIPELSTKVEEAVAVLEKRAKK